MIKIAVIGCGYVGLTTAVGLANESRKIICIDTDSRKLDAISRGISPFYEPGLENRLKKLVAGNKLIETSKDFSRITDSDIIFICVPTPSADDGKIDLTYIKDCSKTIGFQLAVTDNQPVIVVKSTVVPGTTEEVVIPLLEKFSGKKAGAGFSVASNPEFLQMGKALRSFEIPDRIIIGEFDSKAGNVLESLYANFKAPVVRTDIRTAEMIKYASNAFLATKISFINEIGNICKKLGIDTYEVARGIGYDPRIGSRFLNAGLGFGGSCLPKDVSALVHQAESLGVDAGILQSVYETNNRQTDLMIELVKARLGNLENKNVSVLGLAFKPDTDDTRDSPAFRIIAGLISEKAVVKVYDPMVRRDAKFPFSDEVTICSSFAEAIDDSDGIVIVTEWDEFKDVSCYAGKTVFDSRRVLDPAQARLICLHYEGLCW